MALPILRQSGLTDVVISRAYTFPIRRRRIPNQVQIKRADGRIQTATLGQHEDFFELEFRQLSQTDHDNVTSFLQDSLVDYAGNPFTFVDVDGNTHNVRYVNEDFVMPNPAARKYDLFLTLRVEPVAP